MLCQMHWKSEFDRLVKRTDKYRRLAEIAAKKAGWDKQEVLIELFRDHRTTLANTGQSRFRTYQIICLLSMRFFNG